MLTKAILLTLTVVAAALHPKPKPFAPEGHEGSGQDFCCEYVDGNIGEGCAIASEPREKCPDVLHCESAWAWVDDGVVACT